MVAVLDIWSAMIGKASTVALRLGDGPGLVFRAGSASAGSAGSVGSVWQCYVREAASSAFIRTPVLEQSQSSGARLLLSYGSALDLSTGLYKFHDTYSDHTKRLALWHSVRTACAQAIRIIAEEKYAKTAKRYAK